MGFSRFLPLLHNFKEDIFSKGEEGSGRQILRESLNDDIFGQGAGRKGKTGIFLRLPDILQAEKAHFSFRHAPVGISLNASWNEQGKWNF